MPPEFRAGRPPQGPPPAGVEDGRRWDSLVVPVAITAAVVTVIVVVVLVLVAGSGGKKAATPTGPASYADAGQIVAALGKSGLIRTEDCKGEKPVGVAISQQRCGPGEELIAMVFPSGAAADDRIADFAATDRIAGLKGVVVRGSNWVVNVGDFGPERREAIRKALGGTLVNTG